MKKYHVFAWIFFFSLLGASSAFTQTLAKKQRESLRGLDGVYVIVEELKAEAERDGLKRGDLLTDVQDALRAAGIPLLSKEDWPKTLGAPYLYVNVQTVSVRGPSGAIYSVVIEVTLEQGVTLTRDPSFVTSAPTWHAQMLGMIGKEKLPDLRRVVGELVEKFTEDYTAVRPKGPSGPRI